MNHLEVKTKRSFLYASFLLIFAKREILFNVATFDVSLFSGGGRYPFRWSLNFGGSLLSKGRYFGGSLLSMGRYFRNFTVYCMR